MALFETNELKIYNSVTSEKDIFQPLNSPLVGLYVCGPTVYSDVHLGNCRTFISFDMVFRYLQHLGYKVRYVRNITDAGHLENDADEGEDKIAQKARLEQLEPMEIVQKYTVGFHDVMERFNAFPPSIEPTATGHIVEQIEMIKEILDAGLAYEVNGSVYFDVQKYNENKHYGKISGRKIEELFEGTRDLDGQSDKKSSLDFALWKKASPSHIMRWPSPWGIGFPGWHLECSVMSTKYLGEAFDIHGGGMDLKFPHHECEVAQNQAAKGSDGAQVWMHANMLTLNGKRMSKSTGNTLLPYELFTGDTDKLEKGFHPSVVRFFMHQAHYRSVLDFSNDALIAAEKGYMRLMEALDTLDRVKASNQSSWDLKAWKQECYDAMNDDFNSPILIAKLFDAVRQINSMADGKASLTQGDIDELKSTLNAFIFDVLGLQRTEGVASDGTSIDGVMSVLLDIRKDARSNRDFAMSDKIRDELAERGIILKDGKDGTTYIIES